jgi:hypothetical protein
MVEPHKPAEIPSRKRRPAWAQELIRDAERIGAQRNLSGKVRSRSRIPATWHACVT